MPWIIPPLLALWLLLPMVALAQVPVESDPGIEDELRGLKFQSDEPWKEGTFEFPPFPEDDDDLLPVPGQAPSSGLSVLIDPASIQIGEDRVSRYTVVLTSRRGARNVILEGLHCNQVSHRVYAYGDGQGGFGKLQPERWEKVRPQSGAYAYRYVLVRTIICDQYNQPRTPDQVVSRLRYPKASNDQLEY
jgi:hypothetical protein